MGQNPQTGFNQQSAAARSAGAHHPMNPRRDPNVLLNHLARMLPIHQWQEQVYKLGQKHPPGFEDGFCPSWEVATALLPARQTTQLRINFQREFYLIALTGTSQQAGGFRAQFYDVRKQYFDGEKMTPPGQRLAGRGVNFANLLGTGFAPGNSAAQGAGAAFLRDPHPFTEPNAQCLVIIQNQDTSAANNNIQVSLYGVVRRFNWPD